MYNADTYRTILSFDTGTIPDSAAITGVKLKVYRKSLSGTISSIKVDIKSGAFGTSSVLEQADYSAAPSASSVASFASPAFNQGFTEISLPSTAFVNINKTGKTQLRLSASTPAYFTSDVLENYGGEDTVYAPILTVDYY
ncbi:hypothetical protein CEF21_20820 [Bacillus sp. FJAT-42376]|uniref:hypothetical protein n=1 Tax=Bacillus sp. FJAT-42376 TaxID=2014076 RepID=UPI000F515E0A|nr:hypothetical protein [Bacillus sp. FJAT-42376]AZB44533.1 hypothetical protein CEF21_20820 [Bacillus sp. FJAT-42376]